MSHVSKQIVDWFVTTLTGVVGLPTPQKGTVKQAASNADACFVWPTVESIDNPDVGTARFQSRLLTIEVTVLAQTFDAADAMSVLVEEAIAATTFTAGERVALTTRAYDEDRETDRDYVAVTLSYDCAYFVLETNVEAII